MTDTRIVTAPRVRPIFQVAAGDADVDVGQARYDAAHYDTYPEATYAGLDAEWTDDGCDVIAAETWLGRQRSIDVFDVGTATVTVRNPAGLWDYPPVNPATTPLVLRPGRMARVGVQVDDGPARWLLTGWIDATRPDYRPTAELDTVVVDIVCAKGQFGRVGVAETAADVGAGETVVARLTRLADAAGFPAHRRLFDPSAVALIGTRLGARAGELADVAATSAGGDVFGDEAGLLRYAASGWLAYSLTDLDGAIGNRGVDGEVCPNAWEVAFDRSDFTTRVNYGRAGEAPKPPLDDVTNQARYGVETWDMTSLESADDTTMDTLAARALRVRNFDRAPRVAAVTLDAARAGAADLMAAASPFTPTMYACGLVQAGRPVFTRTMYVTGVAHTITAAAWTARIALDDATPWMTSSDARYDTARYDTDRYATTV